eukprot:jgi/Tetstr1/445298/TSEL_033096.t1
MQKVLRIRIIAALAGALAATASLSGAAAAQSGGWQSGEQISGLCATGPTENPVAVTFCLGYLQGALDAFLIGAGVLRARRNGRQRPAQGGAGTCEPPSRARPGSRAGLRL